MAAGRSGVLLGWRRLTDASLRGAPGERPLCLWLRANFSALRSPLSLPLAPLRIALRALVALQPALPEPSQAAVRRAVGLRLTPDERAVEQTIDVLRAALAASPDTVAVVDYGAGTRGGERPPVRRVADIYASAASGPAWGRVLFGLARGVRPRRVLELGTNLGLSAAHLAAALALTEDEGGPSGRLVTLEGAPALAARAAEHLGGLGHAVGPEGRVEVVVGPFAETLAPTAERAGPFDLVFVDGHHEASAAWAYVHAVRPHLAPGGMVVLDDVEPGRAVWRAWRRLRAEHPDWPALHLGKWGLLVPTPARGAESIVARPT